MSGRKLLLTLCDPNTDRNQDSIIRKMKSYSSVFKQGAYFLGTEKNGGNAIGGLYPIFHISTDSSKIDDIVEKPRKAMLKVNIGGTDLFLSQAVYLELEQIDIASDDRHEYDTNAIIFLGCKVLEPGSRTAKGFEKSWKTWISLNVLTTLLQKEDVDLQNVIFLKQISPLARDMFAYVALLNIKLLPGQDVQVLDALQQTRGAVVACYSGLYKVNKDSSHKKESLEDLIETVSSESRRSRDSNRHGGSSRRSTRSANTV